MGRTDRNWSDVHKSILYKGGNSMTVKTLIAYTDEWKKLPWKHFQKNLFRLQCRIYKAAKQNDYDSVKRLQSLLLGSKSPKYLAVRQVTQLNAGKKTAGVDCVKSLNPKERLQLVADLDSIKTWKHKKLRRVFIPKANGKRRPLGIPTISDRAMQCLIKYALEPVYEAHASDGSYGFRPGHSTWDVQNRLFQNLKSNSNGYKKTILELDIEGCFDNISHSKLMELVTLPGSAKRFLNSALKAGVLKERDKTLVGTPQGGVISPLLCNIALHGIEDLSNTQIRGNKYQRGLRYADDMVFMIFPDEDGSELLDKVLNFLSSRGLKANMAKTRFASPLDGFDFLGWHFKVKRKNSKFVCYPSSKNRKQMISKIKTIMKDSRYKIDDRLKMLKTVYRGWWNYHQYSDMKQINLWSIQLWVYRYLRKSSKMSSKVILEHLGPTFNGHEYRVNRYPAARGDRSVYDGDLIYWSKKNSQKYSGPLASALNRQDHRCNSCGLRFGSDDWVELHHKNGQNNDFRLSNVEALHRSCHHYQVVHRSILLKRKSR
nr:group II intron reverse transcriptase/maturase [Entomoneis sp.]